MAITFEKVLVLKNIPLFAELPEMVLADLVSVCEEKTIKPGEPLLNPHKENAFLYLILTGGVQLKTNEKVVAEIGARQMLGETTVMSPAVLPYEAVASEKTTFLRINGEQLYRMMALHPALAKAFVGELSRRLRQSPAKNF